MEKLNDLFSSSDNRFQVQQKLEGDDSNVYHASEETRNDAAIILQTFMRLFHAEKEFEGLKNIQMKKEASLDDQIVEAIFEKNLGDIKKPDESKTGTISPYPVDLIFHQQITKRVNVLRFEDIETLLQKVKEYVLRQHFRVQVFFEKSYWLKMDQILEAFRETEAAKFLQICPSCKQGSLIVIRLKALRTELLGDGQTRSIYPNGVVEIFHNEGSKGTRIFPDGRKEHGEFDKEDRRLISGYRLDCQGKPEFYYPKRLLSKNDKSIVEFEEKLVVLEKTFDENVKETYSIVDVSIDSVVLEASRRESYHDGDHIQQILYHNDFKEKLNAFIESVLAPDETGVPRIFGLSNAAVTDIIKAGAEIGCIDPLKIVNPSSGLHLFSQAGAWGNEELLMELIRLFPEAYKVSGQNVLAEFLRKELNSFTTRKLFASYQQLGGELDLFHRCLLQTSIRKEPSSEFWEEFSLLSSSQKRDLYDVAFGFTNPYFIEPADHLIPPQEYSINLMWINSKKIPESQEYLYGEGDTVDEQRANFNQKFVEPVSQWAFANPESRINIWIDRALAARKAVTNSLNEISNALESKPHGIVKFRDVRMLQVVKENREIFSQTRPVYFRADLLRAIVIDHILRKGETQYCVYADLDVKAMTGSDLFDKRTLNYLDDYGFVMAKRGSHGFENSFQILNGKKVQLLDSHRKVIIDLSIDMVRECPEEIREQQIYHTYPAMVAHFLVQDGRYGSFKWHDQKRNHTTFEEQSKWFRYDFFRNAAGSILPFSTREVKLGDIMPRKAIIGPPSHF